MGKYKMQLLVVTQYLFCQCGKAEAVTRSPAWMWRMPGEDFETARSFAAVSIETHIPWPASGDDHGHQPTS